MIRLKGVLTKKERTKPPHPKEFPPYIPGDPLSTNPSLSKPLPHLTSAPSVLHNGINRLRNLPRRLVAVLAVMLVARPLRLELVGLAVGEVLDAVEEEVRAGAGAGAGVSTLGHRCC